MLLVIVVVVNFIVIAIVVVVVGYLLVICFYVMEMDGDDGSEGDREMIAMHGDGNDGRGVSGKDGDADVVLLLMLLLLMLLLCCCCSVVIDIAAPLTLLC